MKSVKFLSVTVALTLVCVSAQAQFNRRVQNAAQRAAENAAVRQAEKRTEKAVNQAIDDAFDGNKQNNSGNSQGNANANQGGTSGNQSNNQVANQGNAGSSQQVNTQQNPNIPPKLESYSQYDFVPGDQILFYEDFSQDAVGDFPALWTSNKSGEVKTLNNFPGKWFQLTSGGMFFYLNKLELPPNFIIEFDYIPLNTQNGSYATGAIKLYHYDAGKEKEVDAGIFPGQMGFRVYFKKGGLGWELDSYKSGAQSLNGFNSQVNRIKTEQVNHIIIWVQNRRVRIYHEGAKVLDVPTGLQPDIKLTRMLLMSDDADNKPFYSNIKITTAAPDVRSKLITEGKIISYGINFDSGKDVIKPESYGAVKAIADVLTENPDVRVRVVGHTDTDGNADANLDLSKRRAAAVKTCLSTQFGINAARIETDGKGQSEPLAPNNTVEGKAKNRRVEFVKI